MKIVYEKDSGKILWQLPLEQNLDIFLHHYPPNYKDGLGVLELQQKILFIDEHIVVDGVIQKLSGKEIDEINLYGKVLTEEERLCKNIENQLKPSPDEVQKAKNTIEVLELLQEVM